MRREKLDIVAITESWSTPEVGDSELALERLYFV